MARKRITTKAEIIKTASEMFLDYGYSDTTIKSVCDRIEISTGNLTFYFPTKEHLLDILVDMLCDFQWELMKRTVAEGNTSLMAYCLEFITMVSACEQNALIKDFFLSSYKHSMSLETIRRNDVEKAKLVFKDYNPDWDDQRYVEAETLISGIEYATLMTTSDSADIELRIEGALQAILDIYRVPKEIAIMKIKKAKAVNYRELGSETLKQFKEYIFSIDEQYVEEAYAKYCDRINKEH